MTKLTKALLVLAAVNLLAGVLFNTNVIDVQEVSGLYVALPAGAIFFGLFLISKVMEKETARYDAEQHEHQLAAEHPRTEAASDAQSATNRPLARPHSA